MFFAFAGAFLISWAPYAVVSMCQTFTGEPIVGRVVETFPALIAKMSAIWDPVIYIATNLQVRFSKLSYFEVKAKLFHSVLEDVSSIMKISSPIIAYLLCVLFVPFKIERLKGRSYVDLPK